MTIKRWMLWFAAVAFGYSLGELTAGERFDHLVRNDFFAGFAGDSEALARGLKKTEAVLAAEPNHAEALVWHGAGLYYRGGEMMSEGKREAAMPLIGQATGMMDRAVALAPEHIGVRIPRGSVYFASARNMQPSDYRTAILRKGVADYEKALDLQKDHLAQLSTHSKGELYKGLGDAYARLGEKQKAEAFFRRIIEEMPGTVYEKRARTFFANGSLTAQEAGCIGCHTGK
jgi:tetratricopeptide (TPR) repeat protein